MRSADVGGILRNDPPLPIGDRPSETRPSILPAQNAAASRPALGIDEMARGFAAHRHDYLSGVGDAPDVSAQMVVELTDAHVVLQILL
jgi:hypothetical protein